MEIVADRGISFYTCCAKLHEKKTWEGDSSRPQRGHLMSAIPLVFRASPTGLPVDGIGLGDKLQLSHSVL